jgi:hypothetical protein
MSIWNNADNFELPDRIDEFMRLLAIKYKNENQADLLKIVVNAKISVIEGTDHDNWNGGIDYHDLEMALPEQLYIENIDQKSELEKQIAQDINKVITIRNEFIREICFIVQPSHNTNWRDSHSDLLIRHKKQVPPEAEDRIWKKGKLRVFLSHKVEYKWQAEQLKESLDFFGISAFVAHTSITPTQEWLDEIENALFSMDAFVALITDNFSGSQWTDQEIGFALGREVPVIPVKIEHKDPYGFIGKYQALSINFENTFILAKSIFKLLLVNSYTGPQLQDTVLNEFYNSNSYSEHFVKNILPLFPSLSKEQIKDMKVAFAKNDQLHGCIFVCRSLPSVLKKITNRDFEIQNRKLLYADEVQS